MGSIPPHHLILALPRRLQVQQDCVQASILAIIDLKLTVANHATLRGREDDR